MLKLLVAQPFIAVGNILGGMLAILPMGVVRLLFLGVFAALLVWVLFLPPQHRRGEGARRRDDLRYLAAGVLVLQMLCYLFLS